MRSQVPQEIPFRFMEPECSFPRSQKPNTYNSKIRAFWDESFIALMMEAVRTPETSIYNNATTWRYIPEDSNLHIRRRENLESHITYN
jgi:hypothetical protein